MKKGMLLIGMLVLVFMIGSVEATTYYDDSVLNGNLDNIEYNCRGFHASPQFETLCIEGSGAFYSGKEFVLQIDSWIRPFPVLGEENNHTLLSSWAKTRLIINNTEYAGVLTGTHVFDYVDWGKHKSDLSGIVKNADGNSKYVLIDVEFLADSVYDSNLNGISFHRGDVAIWVTDLENDESTDYEQRISSLESWKQIIDEWKEGLTGAFTSLLSSITDILDTAEDHEERIVTLETKEPEEPNINLSAYWKYLDFRDREKVACGYGQDNDLDLFKMQDLGASCENDRRCDCEEVVGECDLTAPLYCYSWGLRNDYLNLEIKNNGGEDIRVDSVEVTDCGSYDRGFRLQEDRKRTIRIRCEDDGFALGDITINYRREGSDAVLSSTGIINL